LLIQPFENEKDNPVNAGIRHDFPYFLFPLHHSFPGCQWKGPLRPPSAGIKRIEAECIARVLQLILVCP
jgi:hypothetical protein